MDRIRSITRGLLALGCCAPLLAAGCQSLSKASSEVKQAVRLEKPPAATQCVCMWQRRLSPLPNPLNDGTQTRGIPGQMFLVAPDGTPAEIDGDLTVVVYDETPRPAGGQPQRPEVWHYTKDTLKRLITSDERFGKTYALFLPWPATWKDVTKVKVMARYQSPGNPDLYAGETVMALDFTDPVWTDKSTGLPQTASGAGNFDNRSVPDANKMLKELKANNAVQPASGSTVPAGFPAPTVSSSPPAGWPANLPTYSPGANVGPIQPIVIQR